MRHYLHDCHSTETARERPRLNLQPRTKPVEKVPSEATRQSSIFGSAKPVDTAAKEREIEEKMKKLDAASHFTSEEKENYPRERLEWLLLVLATGWLFCAKLRLRGKQIT